MAIVLVTASPNIARVAQALADEVIFVSGRGEGPLAALRELVDELHSLDLDDIDGLRSFADTVLAPRKPDAVVSVAEAGLIAASVLSDRLGTPATPVAVVTLMRDKFAMRQHLEQHAPRLSVPYALAADLAKAQKLFNHCPAVVVKPRFGTGSVNVALAHDPAELERRAALQPDALVEAFVPGPEYSIEAFSSGGEHHVVAVAAKETSNRFVELSHIVPPPDMEAGVLERVESATRELLDVLDLRDGPSHTEVRVNGEQVKIIETHNRPGGDRIADLVALTVGIDWRRASVGWPIGEGLEQSSTDKMTMTAAAGAAAGAAAAVFFAAPPGAVVEVRARPRTVGGADVVDWNVGVEVGDVVGELDSSSARLGCAILAGPDPVTVAGAVRELREGQVVRTSAGAS